MKKQKEKFEKNEALEFDARYRGILDELKSMPRKTKDEKEKRFLWLKNHERYDDFVMDVMTMCKHEQFEKLQKMMSNDTYVEILAPDFGMATSKRKEVDWVVLMESIKSAVEDYTGKTDGGEMYTFLQSVGKKYGQRAEKEAGKNDMGLLSSAVAPERRIKVIKLFKKIKDVLEYTVEEITPEEIIEKLKVENVLEIRDVTKKEQEEAVRMVYGLDVLKSLDSPISQEDGNTPLGSIISDTRNGITEREEEKEERLFWKKFSENFAWETIKAATGLENREVLKYFLSKDILILLKLKSILAGKEDRDRLEKDQDKKYNEYKKYLEPKCKQWCHHRKTCTLKEPNVYDGCYIRYGYFPGDDENKPGDEGIYICLKSCESDLYEDIFDNKYTQSAYPGGVQNLDDMYTKPLKDFKKAVGKESFQFTDVYIKKATGISQSKLSTSRDNYEKTTRGELKRLVLNDDDGNDNDD